MKRLLRVLGPAVALTALLAVLIGGTALAAPAQTRARDNSCGNRDGTACVPNDYNYDYNYLGAEH